MKTYVLIALMVLFAGCAKRPTLEETLTMHRDHIALALGGAQVTHVNAPIGPFHLVKPTHTYFEAYVPATKETYYVDAYVSNWTIVPVLLQSDDPIYRYAYYHKTFGVWMRMSQ